MVAAELAASLYNDRYYDRVDFRNDVNAHYLSGYVFSTPQVFIMFRGVRHDAAQDLIADPNYKFLMPDAWFVWCFAAVSPVTLAELLDFAPYHLPYVGWARRDKRRFFKTVTLFNRCNMTLRSIPPCDL